MGDLTDFERPGLGNEIYRHPLIPQTAIGTDPTDGLPRMTTSLTMADSAAPPLEPGTFVCMGDQSVFVVRDLWDQVRIVLEPHEVRRAADGEYFVERQGLPVEALNALGLLERELMDIGASSRFETPWVKVEPLRPQCDHYRRTMTDFEGNNAVSQVERVCTAQKTEGGEYVSLANTRVYACEHRVPRDFVSEERLRKFDERAARQAKKTEQEYDVEAHLAEAVRAAGEQT